MLFKIYRFLKKKTGNSFSNTRGVYLMKKSAPVATFRQDYFIQFTINLKNYNNLYIIIHIRK